MKALIIFLFSQWIYAVAFGQTAETQYSIKSKKAIKLYESTDHLIQRRQYPEAAAILSQALSREEDFLEAHLRIAFCYKVLNNVPEQRRHLERVIELAPDPAKYKNVIFSLGEACFLTGQYEKAKSHIEKFLEYEKADPRMITEARKIYGNSVFASVAIMNPVDFNPIPLPEVINAGPLQYFPVLTADEETLIFTTRAGSAPGFDEDIYVSEKNDAGLWTIPQPISRFINTANNEGTCSISADGKIMIFTSCQGRQSIGSCDLYITYHYGQDWTEPENLGRNINSPSWDSQPTLSADGRKLFFVSDRPGGIGKRDIWVSYLGENSEWLPAVNMGIQINTIDDEISPFIHVNGQTLYFASKGYPGFGGYDLFHSDYSGGRWSEPKNLGYPVNTADDQVSLFVTANGENAYYSQDNYTPEGYPISLIYTFQIPEEIRVSRKSLYVKGRIYDKETLKPLSASIELMDLNLDSLSEKVYSDSLFGEYIMVLTEGSEYALYVNRPGYLFDSRYFNLYESESMKPIIMDFALSKIQTGSNTVLNNIFFE
ncbi:MAG TPA: tetratricopeptide repeat protein, partial [Cyclobacteriaceae bacterium]|nr:tetratricopeptide repeat protein [Cyclobacteriaceae bacterium]